MKSVPGGRSAASARLTLGESTAAVLVMARIEAGVGTAEAVEEAVLVPPEDALREPGRAAREEDIQVVGRVRQVERVGALGGEPLLVVDRAGEERVARVVAHLDQVYQQREVVPYRGQARRESRVIDDGARPAGGEHEAQLVGDVAVVDVDE